MWFFRIVSVATARIGEIIETIEKIVRAENGRNRWFDNFIPRKNALNVNVN